jgi:hypothetical protein
MVDSDVGQVVNQTAGYEPVGVTLGIGTDGSNSSLIWSNFASIRYLK